jgi:hypothetical protein
MKSFARGKREWFDSIVSNPSRLWSARAAIALLLAGAGTEAWVVSTTMVERIGRSRAELVELVSLEDSVEELRRTASVEQLDSADKAAFQGVFEDWDALAAWLESMRSGALRRGWALEWQLIDPQAPQPYAEARKQFVQLHATLPEADFEAAQSFLRSSAQADARNASLVRIEGVGDREGISDLHWTLLVWVRIPRG